MHNKNNTLEKIALFLFKKSWVTLLLFLILATTLGFLIFSYYVIRVQGEEFSYRGEVETPDYELYERVVNWYGVDKEGLRDDSEEEEGEDQGEEIITEEEEEEEEIITEEEEEEEEEEEIDEEELINEEEITEDDISDEEIEDVLANTLFELYEFTEGRLPTVSERAIVWEDLELGEADEYMGTRDQNIEFLQRLKEEMDNTDKDEKSN